MKLSPETKHILIIGGALVLAVVLGIVVYKKYEANSQASAAANDQSEQDQLAYIESLMEGGAGYDDFGDTGAGSVTLPGAPASSMSLADELQQIESAFGFGPTTASTTGSSGGSSGGSSTSGSSEDAGAQAAQNTHNLGSGAQPGQPRAGAIEDGEFDFNPVNTAGPIVGGSSIYSILNDEPVAHEGSYVA